MTYEKTPGVTSSTKVWTSGGRVELAKDKATLLVMLHPQCPCTRATLGELNALLAQCGDKVQVYALFYKPKDYPQDWVKTDLWRSASAIPGVRVVVDEDGIEARRLHAVTSGQVFLFNPAGHLLFSGGITPARGTSGDNAGREAIVSFVTTGQAKRNKTFVFGCSLFSSASKDTPR